MHTEVGRTHFVAHRIPHQRHQFVPTIDSLPIDLITEPWLLYRDANHYELLCTLSVMLPTSDTAAYRDTSRHLILYCVA